MLVSKNFALIALSTLAVVSARMGSKNGTGKPEYVPLEEFPQWQAEAGYWVGEYSLYKSDGSPFTSPNWNYPYDSYKGFITGNIQGAAYRQRNVFLYPPQTAEACAVDNTVSTEGGGVCGVNGNTKLFFADLADPESTDGSLDAVTGLASKTTLVGADNAVLYQVFYPTGEILQSQLTTITSSGGIGDDPTTNTFRTRTAQGFTPTGQPTYASFFRETKVTSEEFYTQLHEALAEYNILESDTCTWVDGFGSFTASPYTPGIDGCEEHLEQSFECFFECDESDED